MKNHWRIVLAALMMSLASTAATWAAETGHVSRQEEVLRKGSEVMPFDLHRTTHFFEDTTSGGAETVTANRSDDVEQIALIRKHLSDETKRFANGDFSDPARIHGNDMPGLAELAAAGPRLRVRYENIPNGASIRYSSDDRKVIAAIHAWFAAQRSDHGAHGHMHKQ
jgi:hypothetical protein